MNQGYLRILVILLVRYLISYWVEVKKTLFDNIVTSAARINNEMSRDFVSEYVKELYKREGFFVALGSLMVDYHNMVKLLAQELPSVLVTVKFVSREGLRVEYLRRVLKDYLTGPSSSVEVLALMHQCLI